MQIKKTMMDRLRDLIIRHEGLKFRRYPDTQGYWTIGIGHNISAKGLPSDIMQHEKEHGQITEDMVNRLYSADVAGAISDCIRLYPKFSSFTENRQIALIDFLFNVGLGTATEFKNTNRCINAGDWTSAALHMKDSLWYRQVKGRGKEIIRMIREG